MAAAIALSIGNFDGVHAGHVALVRQAARIGRRAVALAFDPHPLAILRPAAAPPRLSTFAQRDEWLRAAGADDVVRLQPTREFLSQEPEQFLQAVVEQYEPAVIVEGPDFRFGSERTGSVETLRDMEARFGYRTIVVEAVEASLADQSVVRVSSSMIRWLVSRGRMRDAAALLGRPYELAGTVVEGEKRGRDIGVPTANLDIGDQLLPADGVYAGLALTPDGQSHVAAISVGTKPTFGPHPRVCEAHLIGFDGRVDEYGWSMRLCLTAWIRDQLVYEKLDPLLAQLRRDIDKASELAGATVGAA